MSLPDVTVNANPDTTINWHRRALTVFRASTVPTAHLIRVPPVISNLELVEFPILPPIFSVLIPCLRLDPRLATYVSPQAAALVPQMHKGVAISTHTVAFSQSPHVWISTNVPPTTEVVIPR